MIKHFFTTQFLRFLIVGITAAALHWLARYWLNIWLSFPIAVALAYSVGITIAFELNRRFVFPISTRPIIKQARDFILINAAFFPIVWLAAMGFKSLLHNFGINLYVAYIDGIAHALALAVPMFITFLIYKFIAFGR
jgi:putative flippase GtrA